MGETELYIVDWWVGLVVTIVETELYMADWSWWRPSST